ncbi:MAG TPA: magnesium-translocating P-type ATPase [Verrucomicrobiae bacterium]|nr:magnesium-translocating P-type ATPase [Verrucomicrobiae bacterium]
MLKSLFSKISPFLIVKEAKAGAKKITPNEQRLVDFCALSGEEAQKRLGTGSTGLSAEKVEEARTEFGPNELKVGDRHGILVEILLRFKNPLVIQLLIIAVVSLATAEGPSDRASAVIVGIMVFLSVGLAYFQERRSGRAVEKLQEMVQTNCIVIRDGKEVEAPMFEIVPGDLVLLHAGSIIPADLRLISAKDFFIGQSALTGESMPVEKNAAPSDLADKGIIELPNACFQGSNVVSGTARAVVINTGNRTYFGSISEKLAGQRVVTSFDRGIASFTWLMIRFMIVLVSIVFLIDAVKEHNFLKALTFSLSVAVGLTPEMLPMIVTVNLSKGALAMSKKKVIVKKLNSIQNLGAINILCTDKTGTLTQDRIILEKHVDVTNRTSDDVLRYAYMNSYYQTGLRNLLDRSILSHTDLDVERSCKKVDEIPFDFSRKRMSVVIDYQGDHVLICKGAVEEIYKVCDRYQVDEEINPLIDVIKNDLMEEYEALSKDGYRVVAIAYREFPREKQVFSVSDESNLILLGYIAFFDPPKESAAKALEGLAKMGVSTKILTGDNALVTQKVCRDVGLAVEKVITGDQLRAMTDEQFSEAVEKANVFARLSPSQKSDIIQALQKRGHVVGFMGDGINDALALKVSDVGLSVDTAVDVAKEAADIVLLEKSLLVLEEGILEGRKVFGNIIKYIRMGASSNFGNMFSFVGGTAILPFTPMLSPQILTNNLLYDFSQLAIPTDKVDEEYLLRPRKWNIDNVKKFMVYVGPISSIFDYCTFALMWFFYHCSTHSQPHDGAERLFQTGWFVESLLTQTLIVHIIRTGRIPFIQSSPSWQLLMGTLVVMGIGAWLPYSPLANFLDFVPLPGSFWLWMLLFLVSYSVLCHYVKVWFFNKFGTD